MVIEYEREKRRLFKFYFVETLKIRITFCIICKKVKFAIFVHLLGSHEIEA